MRFSHSTTLARQSPCRPAWTRRYGGGTVCVPVGTIAQAWRSSRQVRLARLLKSRDIDIAVLTPNVARSVGLLCARSGHDDVIDVHVALCARERGHAVATSDPDDMLRIDHALPVIKV
ncbi:MAG: hypothetical protein ABSA53_19910 [Streptosporangiaceae bacterium]